jgi:hypothetical protein
MATRDKQIAARDKQLATGGEQLPIESTKLTALCKLLLAELVKSRVITMLPNSDDS